MSRSQPLWAELTRPCRTSKSLCPSAFTLEDLDKELECMALICALPSEFDNFASSLLLLDTLSKLQSAFHNEETQRLARHADPSSSLAFLATVLRYFWCWSLRKGLPQEKGSI